MGIRAYGHLYSPMLYYGRMALWRDAPCNPKAKTEAVALMTPEQVAASPYFHCPALDSFECTADLSDSCGWRIGSADVGNGLETHQPPPEPRPTLSSQPAPLR